jgi:hypothetical protein
MKDEINVGKSTSIFLDRDRRGEIYGNIECVSKNIEKIFFLNITTYS